MQAYIAAMPGWKRDLGKHLDGLIVRTVPDLQMAVKWNQPFYGCEGDGWFLSFRCFTNYVQLPFLKGTALEPVPPKGSKHPDVRYLDIHEEDELDEGATRSWIEQASRCLARRCEPVPHAAFGPAVRADRDRPRRPPPPPGLRGRPPAHRQAPPARGVFDYVDGGAEAERSMARNSADFAAITFQPRVLAVSTIDVHDTARPPAPSRSCSRPTGFTRMCDPEGELAVARAAARAGLPYALSTLGTRSIEEVARSATAASGSSCTSGATAASSRR